MLTNYSYTKELARFSLVMLTDYSYTKELARFSLVMLTDYSAGLQETLLFLWEKFLVVTIYSKVLAQCYN